MAGYSYTKDERATLAEAVDFFIKHLEKTLLHDNCKEEDKNTIRAKIGFAATARKKLPEVV